MKKNYLLRNEIGVFSKQVLPERDDKVWLPLSISYYDKENFLEAFVDNEKFLIDTQLRFDLEEQCKNKFGEFFKIYKMYSKLISKDDFIVRECYNEYDSYGNCLHFTKDYELVKKYDREELAKFYGIEVPSFMDILMNMADTLSKKIKVDKGEKTEEQKRILNEWDILKDEIFSDKNEENTFNTDNDELDNFKKEYEVKFDKKGKFKVKKKGKF